MQTMQTESAEMINEQDFEKLMAHMVRLAHRSGDTGGDYWANAIQQLVEMRKIALGRQVLSHPSLPDVDQITTHFQALSSLVPLNPIRTQGDYDKAVVSLNGLLDAGGAAEGSALASLVNILGELIGDYEEKR